MAPSADPPGYHPPGPPPAAPEPTRLSYIISALVAAALFAAIVGGDLLLTSHHHTTSATGPTSATTTLAIPTSTTTITTVPGGAPSGDIPAASPTPPSLAAANAPDPVLVVKTLSTYSDWVFAHPDPTLVANYMLPSSRAYSGVKAELAMLAKNGWHERPSVTEIAFAKANAPFHLEPATLNGHQAYLGTTVRVIVNDTPQSSDILNTAGQVVANSDNPTQGFLVVSLAQGSDGQFRISDISSLNPPGGISDFES